ncbi:monosaccharide ABC transporter substrate-binding protein (CUT2 family) [Blastococcus colisei]|uniref:Monosaccharide ABC transporter substrate-binding protein (CUT2 family) n=1 Tax=Blastococcus colisei TaxID=1564162 RepID=A0A543PE71_9ACTN|nr:substrate-binding domain-containing protein [Blastococcus colisei]TQN42384.1 monosaccharide ABC transporter substrate-binding protein (CUT2 family) [Blastococcus colisei]
MNRATRMKAIGAVGAGLLSLVVGCGRGEDAQATGEGSGDGNCTVAFSQESLAFEWMVENSRDMQAAVEGAGCEFIQADAEGDPAKQLQDVRDLLSRQPDLLVVRPVTFEPLAPVPGLAEEAGVPLIVVDRALPGTPGEGQYKAFLTIDFVETGRLVAESVVRGMTELNGSATGRIVHITGTSGASPVLDEQEGIDEVLAENAGIEEVAQCDGNYSREPGRQCMEDLLQRFGAGEIDGVIADNDEMALGAIAAIKAAGRDELLGWIWGKDAQRSGLEAILAGEMRMTISTPPQFGELTMETWQQVQDDTLTETTQLLPKTVYEADSDQGRQAIEERIAELTELGIDCC